MNIETHNLSAELALWQRQRELYSWYCDNVKAVAREKF